VITGADAGVGVPSGPSGIVPELTALQPVASAANTSSGQHSSVPFPNLHTNLLWRLVWAFPDTRWDTESRFKTAGNFPDWKIPV